MKKAKPTSKQKSRRTPKRRPARAPASGAKQRKQRAAPRPKPKARAKPKRPARARPKRTAPARRASGGGAAKWQKFVERHGVVLASARGAVPSVAEAIAGEPIVGSWWSHPKADAIFDALSAIDDSDEIRCFKLVDHKITFVHRRLWPALACLARAGVLEADRVASIQQEHMPTGEHRNFTIPFPDWVPDDVARAADRLTAGEARAQLGPAIA